jgi:Domain of unknown function (DUF1707)
MASGYDMRVGDAEREAAAAELREHYASGRLTLDELNERVGKAFAAKTRGDLSALMTDLPSARPGASGAQAGATPGGPFGASGPFGPSGPFGASGPFGPGVTAGPGASDWGQGAGYRSGAGRTIGSMIATTVVMIALLTIGILGAFGGIGAGRPFGVVLILAALAMLRKLIFGARRRVRTGGPRGRRRW